jgi:hypothetical protein
MAACTSHGSATPADPVAASRLAVADDYWWFALEPDLSRGFCFTWVQGLNPKQVLKRLGGTELERVGWQQLVGSGDGERFPGDRYFIGVASVDDWSLIVEDHGDLGVTDRLVLPLSVGTRVVAHYRAADGHGRFLLLDDAVIELDFDPTAAGKLSGSRATELAPMLAAVGFGPGDGPAVPIEASFALAERLTGIAMTKELLRDRTYLLTTVPRT